VGAPVDADGDELAVVEDLPADAQEVSLQGVGGGGVVAGQAAAQRRADGTGQDGQGDVEVDVERHRGRCAQAGQLAEEAATIAARLGETALQLNAQATLGWALAEAGAFRDAPTVLEAAGELAAAQGNAIQLARIHLNAAKAWQGLGDYAAATRAVRAGIAAAEQAGLQRGLGSAACVLLVSVRTAMGAWDDADATAADALELGPPTPSQPPCTPRGRKSPSCAATATSPATRRRWRRRCPTMPAT